MRNVPEVAGSAKTHRCHTRSWAVRRSPVRSRQEALLSRAAAPGKVKLLNSISYFLFFPFPSPFSSPRPRGDHSLVYLLLCVLAKRVLFSIINLHNSTAVSISLYFLLFP